MSSSLRFVATCVPGVEKWAGRELAGLGLRCTITPGAIEGRAPLSDLRRVLAQARLVEAMRVRPIQAFRATDFETLCRGLAKLPWHAYLVTNRELEVRVTCRKSRLYHSDAVAERVRKVIAERTRRDWSTPDQQTINAHCNRVYVRLDHDEVEVAFDAAGEALHRRGYRKHVQDAPIRETLAALLLELATDSSPQAPIARVWDPCCGSGTIVLEWLYARLQLRPLRPFIMDEWPCFRGTASATSALALDAGQVAHGWGSDISEPAIAAVVANAEALGVRPRCTLGIGDFERFVDEVPNNTAVVTNLPYGVRLDSQREAALLFQRLDVLLSRRKDLRPAVVLWGGGKRLPKLRQTWEVALDFRNGGLAVSALVLR